MLGVAGIGVAIWAQAQPVIDADQVQTPGIYVHRIFEGRDYEKRIERRTIRKA